MDTTRKDCNPNGYYYENLKLFLETGKSSSGTRQFELTHDFVDDIKQLQLPTRTTFIEIGKKYGISHISPERYYLAYKNLTSKVYVEVEESEYKSLLNKLEILENDCKSLAQLCEDSNIQYSRLKKEYDNLNENYKRLGDSYELLNNRYQNLLRGDRTLNTSE